MREFMKYKITERKRGRERGRNFVKRRKIVESDSQRQCSRKVKIKCTLVQALRLCTGRTAHRGSRGIAVLYRH